MFWNILKKEKKMLAANLVYMYSYLYNYVMEELICSILFKNILLGWSQTSILLVLTSGEQTDRKASDL